ncbi:hypothetical protein DESUT3_10050 [Desulfuromonas versatilis]|uniref:DUF721 domain-containing protein n=1 Tax=Desulfuromonas versatilis TaxID=2802975 RepID=A0ABM8HN15_9BACT|nr:hypothetical protein DESUT3_10050 [Desulfuromonas versatilis]
MREYRAWQVWDEVVGPQIAARARPLRIREGVLEVRVEQPVWMQQLQLLKPRILAKLNERLGAGTLKDIYLRRGRIQADELPESGPDPAAWKHTPLTEEEKAEIEATLASLADPEIKRQLRALMMRQAQLKKSRK